MVQSSKAAIALYQLDPVAWCRASRRQLRYVSLILLHDAELQGGHRHDDGVAAHAVPRSVVMLA